MKNTTSIILLLSIVFLFSCNTQKQVAQPDFSLNTETEKVSYSLGLSIGKSIKSQGFDSLNLAIFNKAVRDVFNGTDTLINDEEANKMLNDYFSNLQKLRLEKNEKAGKDFLEANKTKEGVITLASGLQYLVLTEGSGESPALSDKVTTHYHGTLIDGTVFDSSVERGQPASFPVNGVIKGWTEALQLMKTGSKWKLFIPSELAYGQRGTGKLILPNTTLIFDVELISIDK